MRLLLDMNLPQPMAAWLRNEGHDVVHLSEIGGADCPDQEIFDRSSYDWRIVVTLDLDFGEIVGLSVGGTGVVLLRLRRAHQPYLRQRLQAAIAEAAPALEAGALILVEDSRIRI